MIPLIGMLVAISFVAINIVGAILFLGGEAGLHFGTANGNKGFGQRHGGGISSLRDLSGFRRCAANGFLDNLLLNRIAGALLTGGGRQYVNAGRKSDSSAD